jgi:hypothetical protein
MEGCTEIKPHPMNKTKTTAFDIKNEPESSWWISGKNE